MKILLQRVSQASVRVDAQVVGGIGPGLLLFVGFGEGDSQEQLKPMAEKIVQLRVFREGEKHFQRSLLECAGELLVIPQFTLYAETQKGRRPDFVKALNPTLAEPLFQQFVEVLASLGVKKVEKGSFGAYMQVQLENDGPVTIMLEN